MQEQLSRSGLYWLPRIPDWAERLRTLTAEPTVDWPALVRLACANLDFTQTLQMDRAIRKCARKPAHARMGQAPVRLAVLGSSTIEHLVPGLRVGGLRRGLQVELYLPAYGQYVQEMLDEGSGLHQFAPTDILFALDARHLLGEVDIACSPAQAEAIIDDALTRCRDLWRMARPRFGARVVHQTLLPLFPFVLGHNEHRLGASPATLVSAVNARLRGEADAEGVDLLSIDSRVTVDGLDAWHDPVMWHKAKQEIRPSASPSYGEHVGRILAAQRGLSSKCLVLDLDNTLWGGVIGDDGIDGIVLGQGSALGEAFVGVQHYARDLARRGVILAVCSKNDEATARLPFEKHPEMVLRTEDIACFVANWTDKPANIRAIAESLNIGLDSLVLLDDNPFERDIIRRELPMVAVPELADDPSLYVRCLMDAGYFEQVTVTAEDIQRTRLYQANLRRTSLQASTTDLEGFLRDLAMELECKPFDPAGLQRIVQLINKTNQFNLTTRRYGEADVLALLDDPGAVTLQLRLKDRLGENGIIGIVIGKLTAQRELHLDTWLMSCRVLGRKIEEATLNLLVDEARRLAARWIVGEYRPSARNGMVRDHYAKLGFALHGETEAGDSFWRLPVEAFAPFAAPFARIVTAEVTA